MRVVLALLIPLALQLLLYIGVFAASRGGGSFMGLLAMPVAAVTVVMLLVSGIAGARSTRPLVGIMLRQWALAVVPPLFLMIFRALES